MLDALSVDGEITAIWRCQVLKKLQIGHMYCEPCCRLRQQPWTWQGAQLV